MVANGNQRDDRAYRTVSNSNHKGLFLTASYHRNPQGDLGDINTEAAGCVLAGSKTTRGQTEGKCSKWNNWTVLIFLSEALRSEIFNQEGFSDHSGG